MSKSCFQCGRKGADLYGYIICEACKAKLGLFTDQTIKRHISNYKKSAKYKSYEQEINDRLKILETDYVKKKIKLLHIQERLKMLKKSKN